MMIFCSISPDSRVKVGGIDMFFANSARILFYWSKMPYKDPKKIKKTSHRNTPARYRK
jgi:hypothetical protein